MRRGFVSLLVAVLVAGLGAPAGVSAQGRGSLAITVVEAGSQAEIEFFLNTTKVDSSVTVSDQADVERCPDNRTRIRLAAPGVQLPQHDCDRRAAGGWLRPDPNKIARIRVEAAGLTVAAQTPGAPVQTEGDGLRAYRAYLAFGAEVSKFSRVIRLMKKAFAADFRGDPLISSTDVDGDSSRFVGQASVGFCPVRSVCLEGGYDSLGAGRYMKVAEGPLLRVAVDRELDFKSASARAVGHIPVGNGSIFLLGGASWYAVNSRGETKVFVRDQLVRTRPFEEKVDGWDWRAGAGFQRLVSRVGYRVQYEYIPLKISPEGRTSVHVVSFSGVLRLASF